VGIAVVAAAIIKANASMDKIIIVE